MPEFSNSFKGNDCHKILTKDELIRAIRFSIAAEYEAIQMYEQIANSVDDENSKAILSEIADDEKVHAGSFLELLEKLSPEEKEFYEEGRKEFHEVVGKNHGRK